MATPKNQPAYRDPTNDTEDIADLLLVTTSGLSTDGDAGASYLVFNNGSNDVLVSSTNTLPVSLPSGASTAALQTTGNGILTTIDADTGAIATSAASIDSKTPALGQALAAASVPVVLTAAQISTLTPPAAITGFALESGGNLAAIATDAAAIEALLTTIEGNQLADGHNVTIDNASITVAGEVAVSNSSFVVTQATASSLNATVVGTGTFATQATLQAGTAYAGKLRLTDGTTDAEVVPLTGYNAQAVAIVDGDGNQLTSFGGGTQYTEGATDATITGTAMLWEDTSDTLVVPSAAKPLPVEIVAGAGSGGTAAADDADFTAGTTSGTPVMGVYESTPSTVTDGDLGTVGITANRQLKTSAAQSGTWTVDLGATDNAVLDAIAASLAGTLTVGSHAVTNAGTFAVQAAQSGTWNITNISGTVSLPTGAATEATLSSLNGKVTACNTGAVVVSSGTITTVSAVTAITNALPAGTNNIGDVDVLTQPARAATTDTITAKLATDAIQDGTTALTPKFAAIAASSSGNNTIVAAVTSKKIRVLAYNLIGNGAVNAKFQTGAGGTDLTGLKYIAAAGGGICAPFNPVGWFETASGALLNLSLSGAVAVGGELVYVEV